MQTKDVKNYLNQYDNNKGVIRTYVKDEPHIKELRKFVTKLGEDLRDLTPSELLELAQILLRKDPPNLSESSKTFDALANFFGGYTALKELKSYYLLNEGNLEFLVKNQAIAEKLSSKIVKISSKLHSRDMSLLLTCSEKLENRNNVLPFFNLVVQNLKNPFLEICFEILYASLNMYHIPIDRITLSIFNAKDIVCVKSILRNLEKSDPTLITHQNINEICKLQDPVLFLNLLNTLTYNKDIFLILLRMENQSIQYATLINIYTNITEMSLPIEPLFKAICNTHIYFNCELETAIRYLKEFEIDRSLLLSILNHLLENKINSTQLINYVIILNQTKFCNDDLDAVVKNPKKASEVAQAIVLLYQHNRYNTNSLDIISNNAQYALKIAQAIVLLHQHNRYNNNSLDIISKNAQYAFKLAELYIFSKNNCKYLVKYPDCLSMNMETIEFLKKHKLDNSKNVKKLIHAQITHGALLSLLKSMESAQSQLNNILLNQINFDAIFTVIGSLKTIACAADYLVNVNRLNQKTFNFLIIKQNSAMSIAKAMGGHASQNNEGAKNYVQIYSTSKLFSIANKKGMFFTSKESKNHMTLPDNVLIKIAQFCGNGTLEEQTEYEIAKNAYK